MKFGRHFSGYYFTEQMLQACQSVVPEHKDVLANKLKKWFSLQANSNKALITGINTLDDTHLLKQTINYHTLVYFSIIQDQKTGVEKCNKLASISLMQMKKQSTKELFQSEQKRLLTIFK